MKFWAYWHYFSELKDQLSKDSESVLTIGRGEVVTVRVPTHEDGAYLFWEFATDSYDLGFGVYFEWSDVKTNQVGRFMILYTTLL